MLNIEVDFPVVDGHKDNRTEKDMAKLWNLGLRSPEQIEHLSNHELKVVLGYPLVKGYRTRLQILYKDRLETILYQLKTGKFP